MALAVYTLWRREVVRFLRQRSRIVGAFLTPVVFWLLLGSGMGDSFRPAGAAGPVAAGGYLRYFFPGSLLLLVLFTSIFSAISLIQDRKQGFLQSVLVAPVARSAVVLGKVLGGATLALLQAALFLALAPVAGVPLTPAAALAAGAVTLVVATGLTGLGFLFAWRIDSVQGFHGVMNVLLMPMWFLSGALFPASGAPAWLQWAMAANPLHYGFAALAACLDPAAQPDGPALGTSLAVSGLFAVAMVALATRAARRVSPRAV